MSDDLLDFTSDEEYDLAPHMFQVTPTYYVVRSTGLRAEPLKWCW